MEVNRVHLGCMSFSGSGGGEMFNFNWTIEEPKATEVIEQAIDLGINFFDITKMLRVLVNFET